MTRKYVLFEEVDEGVRWIATYSLALPIYDDSFDGEDLIEIAFNAPTIQKASQYAEQYLNKMQYDDETASKWSEATLISIELA